jgi:Isy1-like splicing family
VLYLHGSEHPQTRISANPNFEDSISVTNQSIYVSVSCDFFNFLFSRFSSPPAGLGESRTRELNDEINKLIRESRHWARRVRDLGGKIQQNAVEANLVTGQALCHKGYFYFGAARELPGVAALLSGKTKEKSNEEDDIGEQSLDELSRRIDPHKYFGFEDVELGDAERERESRELRDAVRTWESSGGNRADAPWDTTWEQFVGQVPPAGKQLEAELHRIALARSKAELCEEVEQMQYNHK